jgi:1-acyl-sn-glycerol-3-phosphate acyltransferase
MHRSPAWWSLRANAAFKEIHGLTMRTDIYTGRPGNLFYRFIWALGAGACICLFRLRVAGGHFVPRRGGVILASNHASFADAVFIGVAAGRELSYVTKQEAFPVPILGWLIRKLNAMPIDRSRGDRGALRCIEQCLRAGGAMFISPEGTRNKTSRLRPPKDGVGMLAYRARVPVVPVYISGTVNIWTSLIGLNRVTVRFGKPVCVSPTGLPARRRAAYHSISSEVMHRIGNLRPRRRNTGPPAMGSML